MNNTRSSNPVVLLSLVLGVILILALGFITWLTLTESNIDLSGVTFRQNSSATKVNMHSPSVNAEGLAIYNQSERAVTLTHANEIGLAEYRESEWSANSIAQTDAAGLAIYWQSERFSTYPESTEQGLAIYRNSERNIPLTDPNNGMEIYYDSERGR